MIHRFNQLQHHSTAGIILYPLEFSCSSISAIALKVPSASEKYHTFQYTNSWAPNAGQPGICPAWKVDGKMLIDCTVHLYNYSTAEIYLLKHLQRRLIKLTSSFAWPWVTNSTKSVTILIPAGTQVPTNLYYSLYLLTGQVFHLSLKKIVHIGYISSTLCFC